MHWIDRYGDRDGDGFVEYQRQSADGLLHQGWKDSDDAIFHADGSLGPGPDRPVRGPGLRLRRPACRRRAGRGAGPAGARGGAGRARRTTLRERFEQAFWCEELSTYALALDGDKRPCRVRTSNAGQCLFTGIAEPRARPAGGPDAAAPPSRSPAGASARSPPPRRATTRWRYHNGSVWPHDNALIAARAGALRPGEQALQIWTGLFEAGTVLRPAPDAGAVLRLPAGARARGRSSTRWPAPRRPGRPRRCSCSSRPAWAWRSTAPRAQVRFTRPRLPASLGELRIHNLEVAGASRRSAAGPPRARRGRQRAAPAKATCRLPS